MVTQSGLMPSFAKIIDILFLLPERTAIFMCEKYRTNCFNYHLHSYEVMPSKELLIVKQSDLVDYHVLHQYKKSIISLCLYL